MRKGEAVERTRSNWRCNVECLTVVWRTGTFQTSVAGEAVLITQQFGFLARLALCGVPHRRRAWCFPPRLGPAAG